MKPRSKRELTTGIKAFWETASVEKCQKCIGHIKKDIIAIALWRLGTNVEYQTISHLFGIGLSSVCNILHEVCKAIVDTLLAKYIKEPTGVEAMKIVQGFEERWGFPQCFGAIDGSHIPILPPHDSPTDYYK